MTEFAKAFLRSKRGEDSASPPPSPPPAAGSDGGHEDAAEGTLHCHFNPTTLRLTYNNQFGDGRPFSHARETVAKLDVELVFDNSGIGYSVMDELSQLAAMTRSSAPPPSEPSSGAPPPPSGRVPVIEFHWAGKLFEGVVESMTQTIEYWSREGVPLRATVQLSLKETGAGEYDAFLHTTPPQPEPAPPAVTPAPTANSAKPATDTASRGGNAGAARSIAAFNGLESMRAGIDGAIGGGIGAGASASASLGVSASVNLSAAAGFTASGGISAGAGAGASLGFGLGASAGASASAGIGAAAGIGMAGGAAIGGGAGIGAGAGVSLGAGASVGASAGIGAGAFAGASASAGRSASARAFAGLGTSKTLGGNTGIDVNRLIPSAPAPAIGENSTFDSTGRLVGGSSAVAESYVRIF